MSDDHIKEALLETLKQFGKIHEREKELQRQQWELRKEGFKLVGKIHSLAALCDDIPPNSFIGRFTRNVEHSGLTQAIRNILVGMGEWMTVAQLRDQLIRFRIDLMRYKNPSSSIHTILARFIKSGEVEQKIDPKTKKPMFRAIPPDFVTSFSDDMISEATSQLITPERKPRAKRPRSTGVKLITEKSEGSLKEN